jgi:hypothetical protein
MQQPCIQLKRPFLAKICFSSETHLRSFIDGHGDEGIRPKIHRLMLKRFSAVLACGGTAGQQSM